MGPITLVTGPPLAVNRTQHASAAGCADRHQRDSMACGFNRLKSEEKAVHSCGHCRYTGGHNHAGNVLVFVGI